LEYSRQIHANDDASSKCSKSRKGNPSSASSASPTTTVTEHRIEQYLHHTLKIRNVLPKSSIYITARYRRTASQSALSGVPLCHYAEEGERRERACECLAQGQKIVRPAIRRLYAALRHRHGRSIRVRKRCRKMESGATIICHSLPQVSCPPDSLKNKEKIEIELS
jgi:hypothetical protein